MKRSRALIVLVMVAVSALLHGGPLVGSAQEATPQPVAADLTTFSTTLVGLLPSVSLPADADVLAVRAEFAPGVVVPFASGADAADTLIIIETGQLSVVVENQPWSISRESVLNQAMASPTASGDLYKLSTRVDPGERGTLEAGDMTLIPATADGEMRNLTTAPVSALMILLGPSAAGVATPAP